MSLKIFKEIADFFSCSHMPNSELLLKIQTQEQIATKDDMVLWYDTNIFNFESFRYV